MLGAKWDDILVQQQDLINALKKAIDALENADTGTDSKPNVATEVKIKIGEVTMPSLKLPINVTDVFPFCIPFDIVDGLKCFVAEPVRPRFVMPFEYGDLIDYDIVLEFPAWLDPVVAIIRWGEYMVFLVGWAIMTRNYIKW